MSTEVPISRRPALTPVSWQTASLTLLTVALWGGNPVAVSYSVDTLPPVAVAGIRFAMAAVFMLFWCKLEGSQLRLQPGQLMPVLILGFTLFVQIASFNIGVVYSNSSHASMTINTFVFWVVIIEHFITKGDRLTMRKLVGLFVAFAAIFLLLSKRETATTTSLDQPTLLGDLILLFSAFVLAVKIVCVKHSLKKVEPGKLIFWHSLIGVALFFIYSAAFEKIEYKGFTSAAIWALLYQGVLVAGFCFALQAMLLRRHSASQIAVFSFATPLFGVGAGVLMRGDQLTPWLFVSAAFVALGILLVNTVPRSAPARQRADVD